MIALKKITVFFMPHPAIIIPQIGGWEGIIAKDTIEGMKKLGQLAIDIHPETIIYITPHGNAFSNGTCLLYENQLSGDFSQYGHSNIKFNKNADMSLTDQINNKLEEMDMVTVLLNRKLGQSYGVYVNLDSGSMVPMYFIDKYFQDYNMVHITPGFTPLEENYAVGDVIGSVIKNNDKNILVVCSGDLSHALKEKGPYHFNPYGAVFDNMVSNAINKKNPLDLLQLKDEDIENAAQCGLRSFLMGFGVLEGLDYDSQVLSYEGPFGVGYLTGYLTSKGTNAKSVINQLLDIKKDKYNKRIGKEDNYIRLARLSIEHYVNNNRMLNYMDVQDSFPQEFNKEAAKSSGVFISIYSHGDLRGCIGTIEAYQNSIIKEIIHNSISACAFDSRFQPVEAKELIDLVIKVDILMEPELINSKSDLDVKKYGVIVEAADKRGVLLPNLKGINTTDEQIRIALEKAGIKTNESFKMYRFRVVRHEAS